MTAPKPVLASDVRAIISGEGFKQLMIDGFAFPYFLAPEGPTVQRGERGDYTIVHLPLMVDPHGQVLGIEDHVTETERAALIQQLTNRSALQPG